MTRLFLLLQLSFCSVLAAPRQDEITHLPGFDISIFKFRQYSGYLETGTERRIFYWFIESAKSPLTDPVVVWLHGGPGCSGIQAVFGLNGPIKVNLDGTTLSVDEYSWNLVANMLYIDSPVGSGFSYSLDGNWTSSDDHTAELTHSALKDFYKKFPEFRRNPLYAYGESYGGIFAPTLARVLSRDISMNLKGFSSGSGVFNMAMNFNAMFPYFYYHGFIDKKLWREIVHACCPANSFITDHCDFDTRYRIDQNAACKEKIELAMVYVIAAGVNPLNVFDRCFPSRPNDNGFANAPGIQACEWHEVFETPSQHYLNDPEVRKAVHAKVDLEPWVECRDSVKTNYTHQYNYQLQTVYEELITKGLNILVTYADADVLTSALGGSRFMDNLNMKITSDYQPWYYPEVDGTMQIGGFKQKFQDDFLYGLIKGSGHVASAYQPRFMLYAFGQFLSGEWL